LTNDEIITIISGKLSLFSIINDLTMPNQFTDNDIIQNFNKISRPKILTFDKINKNFFTLAHTQCSVIYNIDGFKAKNQDKVNEEISDIVNKLFENNNREQVGKTILTKFSKEI
jgi:myosin heavy subunit